MSKPSEVDRLLASELSRRVAILSADMDLRDIRAALHSLKGSAALAGHPDLALVISQFGARLQVDPQATLVDARLVLEAARDRLERGLPPFSTEFPEPPPGLRPALLDTRYQEDYRAAARERLAELEEVLAREPDTRQALGQAYRIIHAIKGSAGAIGDDVVGWYCHGVETRLETAMRTAQGGREALGELERHREVVISLIEQPEHALETLRAFSDVRQRRLDSRRPSERPSQLPSQLPPGEEGASPLLRISPALVERLCERLDRLSAVERDLGRTAKLGHELGLRLRELGSDLLEVERSLSHARPSGVPDAALVRLAASARALRASAALGELGSSLCQRHAETLRSSVQDFERELSALRRTTVGWLLERVGRGVERLSLRENRPLELTISGRDLPIDRATAERLVDPVMQLARNAFAHGIEEPGERLRDGKSPFGKISLSAERAAEWLRIGVEDDGRGVDVERIRRLAVDHGLLSAAAAERAEENDLLALLFVPGFTTQPEADALAGRGVGLELAQQVVGSLGGAIRLRAKPNAGLLALIEIPLVSGPVDVLWLQTAGSTFALAAAHAGRVGVIREPAPVPLALCLGLSSVSPAALELELCISGVHPIRFGIDSVFEIERVSIRPIPDSVAAKGPFGGAVLRPDGSLALVLDAALLAARAWIESQRETQH